LLFAAALVLNAGAAVMDAAIPGSTPILPGSKTALWVFAHPDDETLAAAGAIHEHEEAGIRNIVIVVDGGAGTFVCGNLAFTDAQCVAARRYESRVAIASLGVASMDIHHLGWANWSSEALVNWLDDFIVHNLNLLPNQVSLKGHSPADHYAPYGAGGHPVHRRVASALQQMNTRGQRRFTDVRYYRIGHLYDEFTCGSPGEGRARFLTPHWHALKTVAMSEYQQQAQTAQRYGIGGLSVVAQWARVADPSTPECWERPSDIP
jgi:LmbE family N-acetylglucosaminyl deacetylase